MQRLGLLFSCGANQICLCSGCRLKTDLLYLPNFFGSPHWFNEAYSYQSECLYLSAAFVNWVYQYLILSWKAINWKWGPQLVLNNDSLIGMFSSSSQIEGTVCRTFPILISPPSGTLIKGGSGYVTCMWWYVTIHSNIGFLILQLGTSRNVWQLYCKINNHWKTHTLDQLLHKLMLRCLFLHRLTTHARKTFTGSSTDKITQVCCSRESFTHIAFQIHTDWCSITYSNLELWGICGLSII